MIARRIAFALFLFPGLAGATVPSEVQQAFNHYQEEIAKAPKSLALQFNRAVRSDLRDTYPELIALVLRQRPEPKSTESASGLPTLEEGAQSPRSLPRASREYNSIKKREAALPSLPTEAERAKVVTQLAPEIDALPSGTRKVILALLLCTAATEGELRAAAVNRAALSLKQALEQAPAPLGNMYLELPSMIRYEGASLPAADASLDAAMAVLELRDAIRQNAELVLTGIDGKLYNLAVLRGHVVLVNFWATWCAPCRREMPDMEKLYRRFADKGLIVLAVSDEKRKKLEGFAAKQHYTFPILFDIDHKVNRAYFVNAYPSSFLFDRTGKLVAQSINMRTESQFLSMFKAAGLE